MRTRTKFPLLLCGGLAALPACDGEATAPQESRMSAQEVALLAAEFDALSATVIGGLAISFNREAAPEANADAVPIDVQFSRTAACPKGGSVQVQGQTRGSMDRETRTLVLETTSTKTQNRCAFEGQQGATITVDGDPNIGVKSNTRIVNGAPSGLQTLTQKGAFTWTRSTGGSGSCTVDLVAEWNPETRTRTMKGTFCDQTINVTRTRS